MEEIQHFSFKSHFFPPKIYCKTYKCTCTPKILKYVCKCVCSSVSICLHAYCKKILLLWLAVQSVLVETHSEGVNASVARGSWEELLYITPLCCFAQWLLLCLPQSSDHKPLTMAQQPIRYGNRTTVCCVMFSVKTHLVLQCYCN